MTKITVSFPIVIEALDMPARQVPAIGAQIQGYKIATELAGRNTEIYELARVAPTLLERHYADIRNPQLREREGKANKGYFFEAINAAVGPVEGELQIKVPKGCLPVTLVSPIDRFEHNDKTGLWHAVGTNRIQKAQPPEGYQAGFDQDFWPTKTLQSREDAIRALRDSDFSEEDAKYFASYFWRRNDYKDFAAVHLACHWVEGGPRSLGAHWRPGASRDSVGVRAVERRIERP